MGWKPEFSDLAIAALLLGVVSGYLSVWVFSKINPAVEVTLSLPTGMDPDREEEVITDFLDIVEQKYGSAIARRVIVVYNDGEEGDEECS